MPTERRTRHPFHMHDAIMRQPEAFARTVERTAGALEQFASEVDSSERLFLVGVGTSHHAARLGKHLMGVYGGGMDSRAAHSFDFALYGPPLTPEDCVVCVSHRGSKSYTILALERARESGCKTALVTGVGGASGQMSADVVFRTVAQERSAAHTVSYTSAIAVLASLVEHTGYCRAGVSPLKEGFLEEELPAALSGALRTEGEAEALAQEHVGRRRIWLAGGGPSAVIAEEVALKIKETSYLQAEGMPTEAMLHGPLLCAEAEDLFVLVAPAGAAQERTAELAGLVKELGAPYVVVGDAIPEPLQRDAAGWLKVPQVPEPFSSLTCLLPLQLFAYHLALVRGTNPDAFRENDARFPKLREWVRL